MSRIDCMGARLVEGLLISLLSHGEEGERKEKNPLERLVTNKGGQGSPLSSDQPRT